MRKLITCIEVGGTITGLAYAVLAGHLPIPRSASQVMADVQAATLALAAVVCAVIVAAVGALVVLVVQSRRQPPYI